ncbi:hypothetical protein OY671_006269 [Metschnikowia pulcherrima]|nr:hypothetical protein OY671_006269 [Metschnikowia pulcherrima]
MKSMLDGRIVKTFSKKTVINVLIGILLVDVALMTYFQVSVPATAKELENDVFRSPTSFHKKAASLFSKITKNEEKYWQAQSELKYVVAEIPLNSITAQEGTAGPSEIYYDPRLTLAVYLTELTKIGNSGQIPTLPFHWADWVNVSMPDIKFGPSTSNQVTCQKLRNRIRLRPDVNNFCRDKDQIGDDELESLGYRNRDQLPNAVIFGHCPHENPSFNDVRVFMAKSYTMTHLPKPYKVIILTDGANEGTYEFMVNQTDGSDQRMLYSGLTERYLASTQTKVQALFSKGGVVKVSAKNAYDNLKNAVKTRILSRDEDVMRMRQTIKRSPGSSKDIFLSESHFDYPKERIQEQIERYERKGNMTIMDQSYLNGLKACSQYDGTNEPEYFKMALLDIRERKNSINDWGWHYDWRFFNDALFYEKKGWSKAERVERTNIILERLLRNWNRFAEEKGIVSWIMHGPLLSWYWDGLMFPYDVDIDIQMPISELVRLAQNYNQTLVVESPSEGYGKYLIDVGTFIHNRERAETGNHIDARFVDVDSGIYIDITGLSKSTFDLPEEYNDKHIVTKAEGDHNAEVYNDRRKHFYTLPQISPLHYSMIGGVPTFIPNQIEARLNWEYDRGLVDYEFHDWYFVPKLQLWVAKDKLTRIFNDDEYQNEEKQFDIQKMVDRVRAMSDEDGLRLLQDDEVLTEYYLTSRYTEWHMHEKGLLFTEDGRDNTTALDDHNTRREYNELVGSVKFSRPLRKALFEYEAYDRLAHHDPASD